MTVLLKNERREFVVVDWYHYNQLPVLNPTAPVGMQTYLDHALGVNFRLVCPNDTYYIIDEHVKYPGDEERQGRSEEFQEILQEAEPRIDGEIEISPYQLDLIIAYAVDMGFLPNVEYLVHVSW